MYGKMDTIKRVKVYKLASSPP
ncbi:MAG: hypothetical protein CISAcid_14330 [uncultured Acidilobus sp. CIS]|jgi:hypothetical protein|nr:MAG: hypothetical protein CISAcid_14330 [uncultured Acidilobus sp. CIS]